MILNAALAALAPRGWLLSSILGAALMALHAPLAMAADAALLDAIGYSEDGSYFAFEEYGFEDGSGFAYSNIYVIDLPQDAWVVGSPFQSKAIIEGMDLNDIRAQASESAHIMLEDLDISVPPRLIAASGDGMSVEDGHKLAFGMPAFGANGIQDDPYDLSVEVFPTTAGSPCNDWFSQAPRGFSISVDPEGTEPSRIIHADQGLPISRGCPADYRISAVYAPFQAGDLQDAVAMISVYRHGFEGLDRRFIAIPLGLQTATHE